MTVGSGTAPLTGPARGEMTRSLPALRRGAGVPVKSGDGIALLVALQGASVGYRAWNMNGVSDTVNFSRSPALPGEWLHVDPVGLVVAAPRLPDRAVHHRVVLQHP